MINLQKMFKMIMKNMLMTYKNIIVIFLKKQKIIHIEFADDKHNNKEVDLHDNYFVDQQIEYEEYV